MKLNPKGSFLLAFLAAGMVAYGIAMGLPQEWTNYSTIIGYAAVHDYNINRVFYRYYVAVILFPLLWMFFLWALHKVMRVPVRASFAKQEVSDSIGFFPHDIVFFLNSLTVGLVLGLASLLFYRAPSSYLLAQVFAVGLGYSSLLIFLHRVNKVRLASLSLSNLCALPAAFIALAALSQFTFVTTPLGEATFYNWFPLAWGLFAALSSLVFLALRLRSSQERDWVRWETDGVFLVVVPLALFLYLSYLPGPPGHSDLYHSGEQLVTGKLLGEGYFPFRDLVFVHGLWFDPLRGLLAAKLFEPTRWGLSALDSVWLRPLCFIFTYFLLFYFLRKNKVALLVASLGLLHFARPLVYQPDIRFILLPLFFLSLAFVFRVNQKPWFFVLGLLSAAYFIVVPEFALTVICLGFVILIYDAARKSFGWQIRNAAVFSIGFFLLFAVWCLYLSEHDALSAYFDYFFQFARDHRYGSGITSEGLKGALHLVSGLIPVATTLGAFWVFFYKILKRKPIEVHHAVFLCCAFFSALYYTKFLSRMDLHVFRVLGVALVPFIYLLYRLLFYLPLRLLKADFVYWAAVIVGVIVLPQFVVQAKHIPRKFSKQVIPNQLSPRLGYWNLDPHMENVVKDFQTLVRELNLKREGLFDFTNHTELFNFYLDLPPVSRYYYVMMAMHLEQQREVVADLKAKKPKIVVYHVDYNPFNKMDGVPNMIRHYEVSRYLLQNYTPLFKLNGYTLFSREPFSVSQKQSLMNKMKGEVIEEGLHFTSGICDWGFSLCHRRKVEAFSQRSFRRLPVQVELQERAVLFIPEERRHRVTHLEFILDTASTNEFVLTAGGKSAIRFRTKESGEKSIVVPVESCAQWYGYKGSKIFVAGKSIDLIKKVNALTLRR